MKILLIGNTGQVGWELQRSLAPLGIVIGVDYPQINLLKATSTVEWVRQVRPDVIINAAAYTAVDKAEEDIETARALNATAAGLLASEAKALGAAFVHYSTDFVFDGKKGAPYIETDATGPLSAYGQTKLEGEQAVEAAGESWITFRTAWVYSTRRPSFVTKVLGWARKFPELRIVTDQVGCPTWCRMLAETTAQVLAMGAEDLTGWLRERRGLYHLAGDGGASRFDWARAILALDPQKEEQTAEVIHPALTADFPTPAERPAFSILDCSRVKDVFGLHLPPWDECLRLAMES